MTAAEPLLTRVLRLALAKPRRSAPGQTPPDVADQHRLYWRVVAGLLGVRLRQPGRADAAPAPTRAAESRGARRATVRQARRVEPVVGSLGGESGWDVVLLLFAVAALVLSPVALIVLGFVFLPTATTILVIVLVVAILFLLPRTFMVRDHKPRTAESAGGAGCVLVAIFLLGGATAPMWFHHLSALWS